MMDSKKRTVLLCILDGFGYRENSDDNAIAQANTPVWDDLWENRAHSLLDASGKHVGLPDGQMGNSEVGHMNIGAGRVVLQNLPLIDKSISSGEISSNKFLNEYIEKLKISGGVCHLMGLVSDGGVHSHKDHIIALAKEISDAGIFINIHAFLDGRDVPPQSAKEQIENFSKEISSIKKVEISTLCGRFYAMDRDNRWDRVEKAYNLLVEGNGERFNNSIDAIDANYKNNTYDEFVMPSVINDYKGMKDGDAVLFANFRSDRAREILTALLFEKFDGFVRNNIISFSSALGMVDYSKELMSKMMSIFPSKKIEQGLGEVISNAGLKQLRIAETEKYPHVTFFFNGGQEEAFNGEKRILINSPKVETYDLQPEMSAPEVTDEVVKAISSGEFDLIILNYANPDMVGHTGNISATKKAIETIDASLGRIIAFIERENGTVLITADHGNCEYMYDAKTQSPHTAHTLSKVPLVLISKNDKRKLNNGCLADIAPTILELLDINIPKEMNGRSLLYG